METFPRCTSSESLCPGGLAFNNIIACVDSGPDVEFLGIQHAHVHFAPECHGIRPTKPGDRRERAPGVYFWFAYDL